MGQSLIELVFHLLRMTGVKCAFGLDALFEVAGEMVEGNILEFGSSIKEVPDYSSMH